jgi:hypothetical protein
MSSAEIFWAIYLSSVILSYILFILNYSKYTELVINNLIDIETKEFERHD